MKKMILCSAILVLFTGNVFAQQSADDYTRNTRMVPEFWNTNDGWVHEMANDEVSPDGSQKTRHYSNSTQGLIAFVSVQVHKDGTEQETVIQFGSVNVGRNGIKVDGKWHVATHPFFDNPDYNQGYIFFVQYINNIQGATVRYKLVLATVDGIKELVVDF